MGRGKSWALVQPSGPGLGKPGFAGLLPGQGGLGLVFLSVPGAAAPAGGDEPATAGPGATGGFWVSHCPPAPARPPAPGPRPLAFPAVTLTFRLTA